MKPGRPLATLAHSRVEPPLPSGPRPSGPVEGGAPGPETGEGRAAAVRGAAVAESEAPDPGDFLFRGPTRTCEPNYFRRKCDCEVSTLKMGACKAEDCTVCESQVAARRTRLALSRFQQRPAATDVCYTVFTIPDTMRSRCTRAVWRKLRRAMMAVLKHEFGLLFGVESSHPAGRDIEVFAPHLNVVWVAKPPRTAKLFPWELRRLKRRWAQVQGEILGASPIKAVVWHGWKAGRDRIAATLYYVLRPFPGWSHWTGPRLHWYLGPSYHRWMKLPKARPVPWRCKTCGKVYQVWPFDPEVVPRPLMYSYTASREHHATSPGPHVHPP